MKARLYKYMYRYITIAAASMCLWCLVALKIPQQQSYELGHSNSFHLQYSKSKALDKRGYPHITFLISPQNICCEYPQHMFFMEKKKYQGPVVQSVVSLTSSLRVISLTILADSIYNILIFFAEKMWVAFALQKLLTFFQQKISAYLRITRCKF